MASSQPRLNLIREPKNKFISNTLYNEIFGLQESQSFFMTTAVLAEVISKLKSSSHPRLDIIRETKNKRISNTQYNESFRFQ
jgi:hypothetical protein